MSEPMRCPKCQAEIPAIVPPGLSGLCPRGLLKVGLASDTGASQIPESQPIIVTTPPQTGFVPPSIEELAALLAAVGDLGVAGLDKNHSHDSPAEPG
jgi:hypothetical protein